MMGEIVVALVVYERVDNHAWIRINRPEKRNAMNQQAREELRAAMACAHEVSVVVLTGVEDIFCGGIDLKEVQADAERGSEATLADWRALNVEIREHPAVFIACVNGLALGGGVTLTGVCDLAFATDTAQFGMPEVGFGMYPNPAGPATQLSLTRKRAAWLVLTGERLTAEQAVQWGLINEAVPFCELESRVNEVAAKMAAFDDATLAQCKQALDAVPMDISSWQEAFAHGAEVNARIRAGSDAPDAGLARFKRGERNPGQGR
ncbi:MAG: enoyl-CoA hydratase/carnithine racemase [Gammaproteobacteria bacterium]|jgi:enoyl-CoA hydratase/carnithine racemase